MKERELTRSEPDDGQQTTESLFLCIGAQNRQK